MQDVHECSFASTVLADDDVYVGPELTSRVESVLKLINFYALQFVHVVLPHYYDFSRLMSRSPENWGRSE